MYNWTMFSSEGGGKEIGPEALGNILNRPEKRVGEFGFGERLDWQREYILGGCGRRCQCGENGRKTAQDGRGGQTRGCRWRVRDSNPIRHRANPHSEAILIDGTAKPKATRGGATPSRQRATCASKKGEGTVAVALRPRRYSRFV